MIKIYSKNCEHLLRIFSQMSRKSFDQVFLARELCRKARVSESSARKGLQALVQHRILQAVTGPGGGYEFVQHPKRTSLKTIVDILDGKESFRRCVMGLSQCQDVNPCPMHQTWAKLRVNLIGDLEKKTLFDLMRGPK